MGLLGGWIRRAEWTIIVLNTKGTAMPRGWSWQSVENHGEIIYPVGSYAEENNTC